MKKIQMVDLKSQYEKIKNDVDSAIAEVIDNTAFIRGKQVTEFQNKLAAYLGAKHAIGCGNGTDALQVAMMALGLKPGDEVITSDFTFVATVEVIALLGLTPVLVDVNPDTFAISTEAIERAITDRTKAIVPVHLFGQCADMDSIMDIAERHNLFVIEDNAQALGADYTFGDGRTQKAGTIGHIGCTSFFPSKNLGCFGDGGALLTNNTELAQRIESIVNHGMKVRYYHDNVGVNSRLDTLQAAVLLQKLPLLDSYNAARRTAADCYDAAFAQHPKLKIPQRNPQSSHIFHQYTLVTNNIDREALKNYLAEHGIPMMVYYPVPLHLQEAYKSDRYNDADFEVTNSLCQSVISLPMHTELDSEQLEHIIEHVLAFANA